ncbi:EscF/YscF/HrpA family type III secretion system needle major subunit [Salmonella enterica]|uniref:EscF/YscF/HrpA family type III secretion system needle major subunit n=2 Tax=Salmonella enterica TaxID=28901 RepID=A0A3U5NGQ3_SALDZ|nr:type III secretion system needle filament subunit SctF [Salmonella enterica]EAA4707833.1 EscF/YscF/HrpA family type III secretion system needle major subunit [Salmonella enterica subsp. diarizonae]EAW1959826.1 EscF/YscF/HrpA family type III secretion system needle major subunit [Salmonella enterica subsp. enterica]EBE3717859.1 EscF/YscF/HrpA family type III secretion system needle major subunit [Salmonella enterica subsp. diarizonae serovar 42:l,v:1,5,7]EBH8064433.1 EscF/YscF/HrpA family typ
MSSLESVNAQLLQTANNNWSNVQNMMSPSDLNNPLDMLRIQEWAQQYSTAVQLDSAVIKMFKDLLSGITSKI